MGLAEDVEAVVAGAVADDQVPGAAWWAARGGEGARGAAAVLLTNQMWAPPQPPVFDAVRAAVFAPR